MSEPRPASSEAVEQAAAAWVLRHDRGLTAAEQDEYLQWLAADPAHGTAFARHRRNWERLNLLGQWCPEHSARPNRDLLAAPPRPVAPRSYRAWWAVGAGLAATAAALAVGLFVRAPEPPPAPPPAIALIERRVLEDGSVVELNRGAALTVAYTAGERRVHLVQGEAHFAVAKNPARPFVVRAAGVDVRAVGTAFNVRLGDQAVEVVVTEGRVGVAPAANRAPDALHLVNVGERAVLPRTAASPPTVVAVPPVQLQRTLAWQPRLLDFTATPLRDIVAEFNAANVPYRIELATAALGEIQVSASLRSDNIEGFLRLLEAGFDIRVERDGRRLVLHER